MMRVITVWTHKEPVDGAWLSIWEIDKEVVDWDRTVDFGKIEEVIQFLRNNGDEGHTLPMPHILYNEMFTHRDDNVANALSGAKADCTGIEEVMSEISLNSRWDEDRTYYKDPDSAPDLLKGA